MKQYRSVFKEGKEDLDYILGEFKKIADGSQIAIKFTNQTTGESTKNMIISGKDLQSLAKDKSVIDRLP
jgi:hypothetical protein